MSKATVEREDQENINSFSKLNSRAKELAAEVAARKKMLEDLDDAGNELLLSDDEQVSVLLGECFVVFEKDDAEARLEKMTGQVTAEVEKMSAEYDEIKAEMARLKTVLYARLGTSINLEE